MNDHSSVVRRVFVLLVVAAVLIAGVIYFTSASSFGSGHDPAGPGGDITRYHGSISGGPTPIGAILYSTSARSRHCSPHRCRRGGKITRYRYRVKRGSKFIAQGEIKSGTVSLGDILAEIPAGSGARCAAYTIYLSGGSVVDRSIIRANLRISSCRSHGKWNHVVVISHHTEADSFWFWKAASAVHDWVRYGCRSRRSSCERWYRRATFYFHRDLPGDFPVQHVYPFIAMAGHRDGTLGWDKTGH